MAVDVTRILLVVTAVALLIASIKYDREHKSGESFACCVMYCLLVLLSVYLGMITIGLQAQKYYFM